MLKAEADLTQRLAEATAFEEVLRARLSPLSDQLDGLEKEVRYYDEQLQRLRNRSVYDDGYPSIDEQMREAGESTTTVSVKPPSALGRSEGKKQIKRLYHRLARRYHPDLAQDHTDEAHRNTKMAALNEAYSEGSIVEMMALSDSSDIGSANGQDREQTQALMVQALETELIRIRRRKQEIQVEAQNLHNHPLVQLSLQVKLARINGRNLLGEMAVDLERNIEIKLAERDKLRVQLKNLGSSPKKTTLKKRSAPLARRIRANLRRQRLPQPIEPSPKAG